MNPWKCPATRVGARFAVAALLLAGGCGPKGPREGKVPIETPTYAELAEQHNARANRLERFYANGVVGIRWTDEDGSHYEQGDVDIWLRMPSEVAIQISKMSERFFWLGANAEAGWFFDLRKEGLKIAEISGPTGEARQEQGEAPLALSMPALLEMMGLATVPMAEPEGAPGILFDEEADAWVLSTCGQAGPLRLYFDVQRRLPSRIELLQSSAEPFAGEILLTSTLPPSQYEYIFTPGKSPDEFPLVPTLIDIVRADEKGSLKLTLTRPVRDDESFQENYFNLNWLLAAFQPDEVRDRR